MPKELTKDNYIFKNVDFVYQNEDISSLMLMMTYNCQLDCGYCGIKQKESRIKEDVYKKAIKVLFTSRSNDLLLRFWGGEPLLYSDLMFEIVKYCEDLAGKTKDKNIKFALTTNGLNLNKKIVNRIKRHNMQIMLSIDGDEKTMRENRSSKKGHRDYFKTVLRNLSYIQNSNVSYFVNMNISPRNVKRAFNNFKYLANKKIKDIQVVYETGVIWQKRDILKLMEQFEKMKNFSKQKNIIFMNIKNNCEPVMLSDEIIVDIDGRVYFDIAIFHEKMFPKFRKTFFLNNIDDIANIQDFYYSKKDIFQKLLSAYPANSEKISIILNNIKIGLILKEFIEKNLVESHVGTENKYISNFLRAKIEEQMEISKKYSLGIEACILHVNNNCENNCIFCKNKNIPITSLENIEYRIMKNADHKYKKLCLVGNEPLNHPEIIKILKICKKNCFSHIEVMTSGMYLTDMEFVKKIKTLGAKSFSLPIYSIDQAIHDKIVGRRGDFKDLTKALDNLRKLNLEVYIHTNLLKQNLNELSDIEKYTKKFTNNFCILPLRCKTSNYKYSELMPDYKDIINKVKSSALVGFPVCVKRKISNDLFIDSKIISSAIKVYLLDQNYIKLKECKKCLYSSKCVGTFEEYVKIYGVEEICSVVK